MIRGSRRTVLMLGSGAVALATLPPSPAGAADPTYDEALRAITGGRDARPGRIALDLPKIAETGNSVPLTVRVESPMTAEDHVARIHLLSQDNPRPNVATSSCSPPFRVGVQVNNVLNGRFMTMNSDYSKCWILCSLTCQF